MANISDVIENFLLSLFGDDNSVSISRNELAHHFNCAPSQINYVLATRFTVDRGFTVLSRRGGGGFVSLVRLATQESYLFELVKSSIGDSLNLFRASQILDRLAADGIINSRERAIAQSMMEDKAILNISGNKDVIRASIFKNFLLFLLREENGGEQQ